MRTQLNGQSGADGFNNRAGGGSDYRFGSGDCPLDGGLDDVQALVHLGRALVAGGSKVSGLGRLVGRHRGVFAEALVRGHGFGVGSGAGYRDTDRDILQRCGCGGGSYYDEAALPRVHVFDVPDRILQGGDADIDFHYAEENGGGVVVGDLEGNRIALGILRAAGGNHLSPDNNGAVRCGAAGVRSGGSSDSQRLKVRCVPLAVRHPHFRGVGPLVFQGGNGDVGQLESAGVGDHHLEGGSLALEDGLGVISVRVIAGIDLDFDAGSGDSADAGGRGVHLVGKLVAIGVLRVPTAVNGAHRQLNAGRIVCGRLDSVVLVHGVPDSIAVIRIDEVYDYVRLVPIAVDFGQVHRDRSVRKFVSHSGQGDAQCSAAEITEFRVLEQPDGIVDIVTVIHPGLRFANRVGGGDADADTRFAGAGFLT